MVLLRAAHRSPGQFALGRGLRTLVIVTDTQGAFLLHSMGPEALEGGGAGHGVMGEEKPEAEDRLGKNVEYSVGDNLGIDVDVSGAISNTPDASFD